MVTTPKSTKPVAWKVTERSGADSYWPCSSYSKPPIDPGEEAAPLYGGVSVQCGETPPRATVVPEGTLHEPTAKACCEVLCLICAGMRDDYRRVPRKGQENRYWHDRIDCQLRLPPALCGASAVRNLIDFAIENPGAPLRNLAKGKDDAP